MSLDPKTRLRTLDFSSCMPMPKDPPLQRLTNLPHIPPLHEPKPPPPPRTPSSVRIDKPSHQPVCQAPRSIVPPLLPLLQHAPSLGHHAPHPPPFKASKSKYISLTQNFDHPARTDRSNACVALKIIFIHTAGGNTMIYQAPMFFTFLFFLFLSLIFFDLGPCSRDSGFGSCVVLC